MRSIWRMKNKAAYTYIIAEAGVNHNGEEKKALQLIDIAVSARADAVKFQMFDPAAMVTKNAAKADYQSANLADDSTSQLEMLKKLALPSEVFVRLAEYCKERSIDFLCTPFDAASLDYLVKNTQMRYLKLSSGELTNGPFLLAAARSSLPLILSTGMSDMAEIGEALCMLHYGFANATGYPTLHLTTPTPQMLADLIGKVTLLHCVSQYPAPLEAVNMQAMDTMAEAFHLSVGLSDHSQGIHVPIAAVACGAAMIEKHFTYDKEERGPDHKASLSPWELAAMVAAIRDVAVAMGNGQKICQPVEENTRDVARKSLVAARAIAKGEVFTEANLTCKRPEKGGISPNSMFAVLGKPAKADYAADDFIQATELD